MSAQNFHLLLPSNTSENMADKSEVKKYNYMENVLAEINRNYISLPENEVKRNNRILETILTTITNKMKEKDPLFKVMFSRVFYGGSYYDGLRVGKPEEFDLDLLLSLPKYAEPVLNTSNVPGFVHLQLKKFDAWMKQPEAMPAYRTLGNLLDKDYFLDTQKVLAWMEGVVAKILNDFPQRGSKRVLTNEHGSFEMIVCKGGPAMTLKIKGSNVSMDVDLVACFIFRADKWPKNGFKANPVPKKPDFFVVPKKPKKVVDKATRYWRLSFQEQERILMDNKRTLKPTVKLLKKLRDNTQQSFIASYYIKTVLLHIADTKNDEFWKNSLSYVFMTVLKDFKKYIDNKKIPYYWNKNNNLISGVSEVTLQNFSQRLNAIINDIERNPDDPTKIAKYLLNAQDMATFRLKRLSLGA